MVGTNSASAVTQEELDAVQAQLESAKAQAEAATEAYYQALDAHDAAVTAMNETQIAIDNATANLNSKQDRLKARAVSMYRNGTPTMIDVIMESASFDDFANAWMLLSEVNDSDAKLIGEIKDIKVQLQAAHDEYAKQEQAAAEQMAAAEQARVELDSMIANYEAQYNSLSAEMQAQIAAAQAAQYQQASVEYTEEEVAEAQQQLADAGYVTDDGSIDYAAVQEAISSGSLGGSVDYNLALSLVGSDYEYGSTGPYSFDCSGLAYYCGAPYRSSSALYSGAAERVPVSEAQPGDVLWTNGHVGISLGGNTYVHASDYGIGVIVSENADSAFQYVLRY